MGYVGWTEQRNFEAVLDMMAAGKIDVKPLISHRFSIDEAEKAYELLGGTEPYLGILLNYPQITQITQIKKIQLAGKQEPTICENLRNLRINNKKRQIVEVSRVTCNLAADARR